METLFIGKNLLFLTEVESTNTYAMDLLRNVNAIEGTVVYTSNQTKGRGQRGSSWSSETASNISASVVLKPQFLSIEKAFYLSKISALALYDVLAEILPSSQYDIKIKWPNDILVNKYKISGVLIENVFHQHFIHYSVIGVGLNVNQTEFGELNSSATSLKKLVNANFNTHSVLEKLCVFLEKWYLKLKENKWKEINESYLKHLYGFGQSLHFIDSKNNRFEAKMIDVNQDGKLCLQLPDLTEKKFDIKELKFIINPI